MNLPPIFRSKRFWSAVAGVITLILNDQFGLNINPDIIAAIALLLIGGYNLQDFANALQGKPSKYDPSVPPIEAESLSSYVSVADATIEDLNKGRLA